METEVGGSASYLVLAAVVAPFVIGGVEIAKRTGLVDRYAAVAALILGVAFAVLVVIAENGDLEGINWGATILAGVVGGMTAAGVYSGTQSIRHPDPPEDAPV
jgi:peptidoglycan/LPS O-acetylase OafA/YrhL